MKLSKMSLAAVASVALAACNPAQKTTQPTTPTTQTANQPNPAAGQPEDSNSNTITPTTKNDSAGTYTEYQQAAIAQTATDGDAVLFFHATWCPDCKAADKDIKENLSSIPEGLTIFKTDYDTHKALREKYEIVSQHTFVQVDAEGNMIKKWSGGKLQEIIDNVNEA